MDGRTRQDSSGFDRPMGEYKMRIEGSGNIIKENIDFMPISDVRNPVKVDMVNNKLKLNNLKEKNEVSAEDLIQSVLRDEKRNRERLNAKYNDCRGDINE